MNARQMNLRVSQRQSPNRVGRKATEVTVCMQHRSDGRQSLVLPRGVGPVLGARAGTRVWFLVVPEGLVVTARPLGPRTQGRRASARLHKASSRGRCAGARARAGTAWANRRGRACSLNDRSNFTTRRRTERPSWLESNRWF